MLLGLIVATGLLTPILILISFVTSSGPLLAIERAWAWIVAKSMRLTFSCEGMEKVVPGKSYIVAPNHQSNADILALLVVLPMKFRWVVKRELLIIPLFGWALARTGAVALNRKDRSQSISRLQEAAGSKFEGGWSVLIYPEGTRSPDGNLQEFKKGAFMMSVQSGIPILPVICNGAFKVLPKKTIFVRPGHVSVTIGDPIDTAGLTVDDIPQLMDKTREAMLKHFDPDYDPFKRS
ncbi:MAG: 1-acyl-sn-glycerol-3-phosphate acyltransferase [Desulfomonile tiedjei]|uniref:1-acyl-sn-glycerol-3-phosphate acyltransferase n=1 Tax=Desulfomonile tiedjei TaxID=2358 RepID=A0A9D6YZG6_9BACT|nr:1-acyl-sn-glycerol-3-phosphate acyltransferase [Desulfomonile tiedjei]